MKRLYPVLIVLPFLAGCATYTAKQEQFHEYWAAGQLAPACSDISSRADRAGKGDKVIYRLEQGAVQQYLGKFPESIQSFREADEGIKRDLERGTVRVSEEASGALVNQAARTYQPCAYDRIMLKTYLAMCYLAMGDTNSAHTEMMGAYDYQRLALEENAKRVEKAAEKAKAAESGNITAATPSDGQSDTGEAGQKKVDVDRVLADPKVKGPMENVYRSSQGEEAKADYVNPFTTLLFALDLIYSKADTSNAENSLGRLQEMVPNCPAIAAEREQLAGQQRGQNAASATYLVVETGQAPRYHEIRIDIPLFLANNKVPYVGAAFPVLASEPQFVSDFTIEASGCSVAAAPLADFDRIVQTDFRNKLPGIITRTIISTTVKATANAVLENQAGTLGTLAGVIYQAAVNIADTRSWTTLPKQILVARVPSPENGKIRVHSATLGLDREVEMKPARLHIVWVRSISPRAPVTIAQLSIP